MLGRMTEKAGLGNRENETAGFKSGHKYTVNPIKTKLIYNGNLFFR